MLTMAKMNTTIKPILILMLTFELLFAKQLIQAQDGKQVLTPTISTLPPPPIVVCQSPIDLTVDSSWLEKRVFGDFRIWHIMFSALGILTVIAVLLCCLFRCRIPRTKQEIEADYTRKKITKLINAHLRKIKLEELEYDPSNLLPVLKRVEDLEENRVKKHRSFETRRLNWRQKMRRFFTRKDASFEDDYGDVDQKGDGQSTKMTKEEMERIENAVESAKIDSTAFNIITDQISVLSYFESDRTRKKRLKEENKKQKQLLKELKKKEKADAKSLKQELKKQSTEKNKMLQLSATDLVVEDSSETLKTIKHQPVAVTTLNMESEDGLVAISPSPEGVTSIDEPKKLHSKFSFRNTVTNLMSGLRGGRSKRQPETEAETIPDKTPMRDEVVINIGMVGREKLDDPQQEMKEAGEGKEFDVIPQIEIPPEGEKMNANQIKKLRQKQKMLRMNAVDKNLLQIPEVSIKEINVEKDKKKIPSKEEKKNQKDKDRKKEDKKDKAKTRISDKDKDKQKSNLIEEECKNIKQQKNDKKKESQSKHQTIKSIKKDELAKERKEGSKQKPEVEPKKSSTIHFKRVIFEPIEKDPGKVFKKSVQPHSKESIDKYKTWRPSQLEYSLDENVQHRKSSKGEQKIVKQQARTSSPEIEIPVEHVYTDPKTMNIQVHPFQDPFPLMPMSSTMFLAQQPEPLEHMASIEAIIAKSSKNDEQRKLYIEKTRNVKFDVPGTSGTLSKSKHSQKPEEDDEKMKKKKKKVKLPEMLPENVSQQEIKSCKSSKRKDLSGEDHKSNF